MLIKKIIDNNSDILFISFSPLAANGKFLFYKMASKKVTDCIFFCDDSDNFYVDHFDEMLAIVNLQTKIKKYKKIVICGFSAGAFAACWIATKLNFEGRKIVYAFSPHVSLGTYASAAFFRLSGQYNLADFSLLKVLNQAFSQTSFHLYFPTDSGKDSLHLRDSFALTSPNVRCNYVMHSHDTRIVLYNGPSIEYSRLLEDGFCVHDQLKASHINISNSFKLAAYYEAELREILDVSVFGSPLPGNYPAEFCYWFSRQLARSGDIDGSLKWGWAAIFKSSSLIPVSYVQTLGHFAFNNGRFDDLLKILKIAKEQNIAFEDRIYDVARLF